MDPLTSIAHLVVRTRGSAAGYMGAMIFALVASSAVFILRLLWVWRRQGRETMRQEWNAYAGCGLALTIALWLSLFGFSIGKVIYDDHRMLIAERVTLTAETAKLRASIGALENDLRALQNENERLAQGGRGQRDATAQGQRDVAPLQHQERPRIRVGEFQVNIRTDLPATITAVLAAHGARVAKEVRHVQVFDFTDRPGGAQQKIDEDKIFADLRQQIDRATASEGDISPADGPRRFTIVGPLLHGSDIQPFSTRPGEIRSIRRNDQGLMVAGIVRYTDDGTVYYTEFCSYVIAPTFLPDCVGHNRTYRRDGIPTK
jgi:hypothetical protein